MTVVKHRHFQYIEDAMTWINLNNIEVISVLNSSGYSEGVYVVYKTYK